jgi:hypothetical protein
VLVHAAGVLRVGKFGSLQPQDAELTATAACDPTATGCSSTAR